VLKTVTPPRESWDIPRGQEIDESLVAIAPLGGGTRYEVYQAWDRELFATVAVKVVRPHRLDDDRLLEGFEREVAIAERLAHPYLVRLLRWTLRPPRPYLVYEYVSAPTLAAHLEEEGTVSIPETSLLGIRMLGALHHMHSRYALHLDVKPDNVTTGDPPRLLDLSLARSFSGPVRMRHTVGTSAYMPPEQCEHGMVTPASDLFSLGATLYEAVSGMRPFPEGDEESPDRATQFPQLVQDAQPLSEAADMPVPEALERVIMACLARDPARRPRSAIDAAVALENVIESLGIEDLYAWPKGLRARPR
jgi:eukaryotic-like serine/threonine-protein kinase